MFKSPPFRLEKRSTFFYSHHSQSGAVLLVSLIILMVISLLGISSMQSSNLQMKMASTNKERQGIFVMAEAGLQKAEEALLANPPTRNQMYSECGIDCYNPECTNGVCFDGTYLSSSNADRNCILTNTSDVWSDASLWASGSGRYKTIELADASVVKYITEFMCFSNKPPPAPPVSADDGVGLPLFRITALAEDSNQRMQVMLQSIFTLKSF